MSRAVLTASAVWSGSIWKTPKPSCGIFAPLLSSIVGTSVMYAPPLAICRWQRAHCGAGANRPSPLSDEVERIGIRSDPTGVTPVKRVDRGDVGAPQLEVEYGEVL